MTTRPPHPHRQEVMQRALAKVRALVKRGLCDLLLGDESGFCLVPVVPYLWQKRGQTVPLAAQSHNRRLNVLGLFKEAGLEEQSLIHRLELQTMTSHHFVESIEEQVLPFLGSPAEREIK